MNDEQEKAQEPLSFRVTFTVTLCYSAAIEAETLEAAQRKSEEIYETTDFADYDVDNCAETWKSLR